MRDPKKSGVMGFLLGSILTLLLVVTPVFAATGVFEAVMNAVNIMVDGKVAAQIDTNYVLANGEQVPYSILYKGTTYLPVRKVSELLGKEINYIASSKTVVLGALPESTEPGWYLINKEFVNSSMDFDVIGYWTVSNLRDKYMGEGDEGSYVITHERYVGSATLPEFYSNANVKFSGAPTYMAPEKKYSMQLSHELINGDWGSVPANISLSVVAGIGGSAAGDIAFINSEGNSHITSLSTTVTTQKVLNTGKAGSILYLKVALGHGYGYRYTYEWRD